jgi:hypothetical protein
MADAVPREGYCIGMTLKNKLCRNRAEKAFKTCKKHRVIEHFGGEMARLNLRDMSISRKKKDVWEIRDWKDLITGLPLDRVEAEKPEVDHVIEIQQHEWVFQRALYARGVPVAARTRSADLGVYRALCNDATVLTVTTQRVNRAKKGPIQRFLGGQLDSLKGEPLEAIARTDAKPTIKEMVDNGSWDRLEKGMVMLWEEHIKRGVEKKFSNEATKTAVIEAMEDLITRMGLW